MKVLSCLVFIWLFGLTSSLANADVVPQNVGQFLNKYCADCHGAKKQKADFRVDQLKVISSQHEAEAWQLVLDNLHLQEMPPEDAPQPSNQMRTQVTDWIEGELKKARKILRGHTGEVVLRRLNRLEYENTIYDIFGLRNEYGLSFPEDAEEDGFDNNGAALVLSAAQIHAYMRAAEAIIDDAIVFSPRPTLQSKRVSLNEINKRLWEKWLGRFKNQNKRKTAKMAPDQKRQFIEKERRRLQLDAQFPAVKNGRLAVATPDDPPNADYAMLGKIQGQQDANAANKGIFSATDSGWYEFTIRGYALNTKGFDIRMKVVHGKPDNGSPLLAGYAVLKENKPEDHAFRVRLEKGEYIRISEISHGLDRKALEKLRKSGNLGGYSGPFSVVSALAFKGPMLDEWPPKGHKAILGGVNNPDGVDRKVAEASVDRLAPMLFRRPISKKTKAEFLSVYDAFVRKEKPLDALKTMLQAMLVSPQFLYHYEGEGKIDDFALASRLSYFLWRSTPDDQLLELAESDKLSQAQTLRNEIKRMLADDKSKRFVRDFTEQWLQIDRVGEMQPHKVLYPEYNPRVKEAMLAETHGFVGEVFYKNLPIDNFIDSDWTILNEALAKIYKIPNVEGPEYRSVKLDKAGTVRGGLLTHASILNVTSNGTSTSPVTRGVWLLDQFLGKPAPPPPPDVPAVEPDLRGATTIKEQLAKHREIAACGNCHRKIDPFGVALESFDVVGQFRSNYRALAGEGPWPWKVEGKKVEPFDSIPNMGSYKNFAEFRDILQQNKQLVYHNLAHKLATFALGRSMDFSDREFLDQIVDNTVNKDRGMQTMVYELITNPIFTEP